MNNDTKTQPGTLSALPLATGSAIVCPGCGWTGVESGLSPTGACPRCEYENGTEPYRLLTVTELLADESGQYANVNMGKFLRALAPFLSPPRVLEQENSTMRSALENAERDLVRLFTELPLKGPLPSPSVMQECQAARRR